MKLIKISTIENKEEVFKIWNDEYGYIFPITNELFIRNLENAYDEASLAAIIDGKVVGFVIGKIWQDEIYVKGYDKCGWLSLIYVTPAYRKQGIGTAMLNEVAKVMQDLGKIELHLGRDCHNYFPGLPVDLISFTSWFEKRGFEFSSYSYDLISKNDQKLLPIKNKNENYQFRKATPCDKEKLIAFLNRVWPGRWTQEAVDYYNHQGTGEEYLICVNEKDEICGFSKVCYPHTPTPCISYGTTWRARFDALGGIGPLGVDPAYRGRGLGYDIVAVAVNMLKTANVSDIIIDWTGLLEFYRHMGFEVWKSYIHASKKLTF